MGSLSNAINIRETIKKYDLKNYVETGVGRGDTMSKMTQYNLNLYGIEYDEDFFVLYNKFPQATILAGKTIDKLAMLLNRINEEPTLFWLDAHYPGSDFKGVPYDSVKDKNTRVPLEAELNILKNNRDISNDVIVMDDLRIYKEVPNAPWELKEAGGEKFIYDILSETHNLEEKMEQQGYIIARP